MGSAAKRHYVGQIPDNVAGVVIRILHVTSTWGRGRGGSGQQPAATEERGKVEGVQEAVVAGRLNPGSKSAAQA